MAEELIIGGLEVSINKTFFDSSVIRIKDSKFKDMPQRLEIYLQYSFVGEDKVYVKKHSATKEDSSSKEYKLSCGKKFTMSVTAKSFMASKAALYLSNNPQLDIGEKLIFDLKKSNDKYYLIAKGVVNLPDTDKVIINNDEYSAKMLRNIATTFIPKYSGAKSPSIDKKDRVLWNEPTDWIVYDEHTDDFKQSMKVYNAVYMWIGHMESKPRKKYVYVGIVGDDNNINNSVGNRMQQHIREKKITIDYFRYSELVNCGTNNKVEVLKTVEMQCINIISGLVQGEHEQTIHGKCKSVTIDNDQYEMAMPNKSVRFQQGYGKGDLKSIS